MPTTVTCTACGKSLNVKDEYLGKRLKCPGCGNTFTAEGAASPAAAGARGADAGRKTGGGTPRLHISPGIIALIVTAIAIPTLIALYTYGPYRVNQRWRELAPTAELEVKDIVDRGLQAHLSEVGSYNPNIPHQIPHALDITFMFGPMHMSMPEMIGFAGTTTQGAFGGNYFTETGEIEVDVEVGGLALPGTGALKRGNKTLHITGRVKNGVVSAEIDGKPAVLRIPPAAD